MIHINADKMQLRIKVLLALLAWRLGNKKFPADVTTITYDTIGAKRCFKQFTYGIGESFLKLSKVIPLPPLSPLSLSSSQRSNEALHSPTHPPNTTVKRIPTDTSSTTKNIHTPRLLQVKPTILLSSIRNQI